MKNPATPIVPFPNIGGKRKTPWGEASHTRGQVQNRGDLDIYFKAAVAFLNDYPVGSRLTDVELDQWFVKGGFLIVPRTNDKKSNEWNGHLMKRRAERMALNKAAEHYRMTTEFDSETFMVVHIKGTDQYEVRALQIAVFVNEWQQRADRHTATIMKQMRHVMQGLPWESIPPHVRANIVRVYRELGYFQEDTAIRAGRMNELVQESYAEIESLIGSVALRQLLESPEDDNGK